jgi:hypothetical protein
MGQADGLTRRLGAFGTPPRGLGARFLAGPAGAEPYGRGMGDWRRPLSVDEVYAGVRRHAEPPVGEGQLAELLADAAGLAPVCWIVAANRTPFVVSGRSGETRSVTEISPTGDHAAVDRALRFKVAHQLLCEEAQVAVLVMSAGGYGEDLDWEDGEELTIEGLAEDALVAGEPDAFAYLLGADGVGRCSVARAAVAGSAVGTFRVLSGPDVESLVPLTLRASLLGVALLRCRN